MPYNPQASGGSNLAVSNPELDKQIAARVAALRAANPDASTNVPVELVTASASGLDNNITPQAAAWQIPRVAKARNLSVEQLTQLIAKIQPTTAGEIYRPAGRQHCRTQSGTG